MPDVFTNEERDRLVAELYDRVLEIEQRLIPTGLHVFGRPPEQDQLGSLLQMAASFDRFDPDPRAQDASSVVARALTDLVAQGLGFPAYAELIRDTAASEEGARRREHVESIVRQAIAAFLQSGPAPAVEYLVEAAAVPSEESLRVFSILEAIRGQLQTDHELDGLVRALRG